MQGIEEVLFRVAVPGCYLSCFHYWKCLGYILPDIPNSNLCFPIPEGILALIREKPALFGDHTLLCLFGYRGLYLQMEITANSTY